MDRLRRGEVEHVEERVRAEVPREHEEAEGDLQAEEQDRHEEVPPGDALGGVGHRVSPLPQRAEVGDEVVDLGRGQGLAERGPHEEERPPEP